MSQAGCSLSAGYAMRAVRRGRRQMPQRSDKLMYADKAEYYRQSGMDRRRQ